MTERGNERSGEQSNQQGERRGEQGRGPLGSGGQQSQGGDTPLRTDYGETSIQNSVVAQVAGIAANEVEGIRMGGDTSQRASGILGSITGGSGGTTTQGVSVEVGKEEAAVDLTATVEYGRSAPQVAEAVRQNVISRIWSLLGLRVNEVNVEVSGLFFPDQEQNQRLESGDSSGGGSSRVS